MEKRGLKDQLYKLISELAKSMANPHRLEIIDLLAQGEFSVEHIAGELNLSIANTSQHLQTLKKNSLVKTRRYGNHIYYTLSSYQVYHTLKGIREMGQTNISALNSLMHSSIGGGADIKSISLHDMLPKLEKKEVVLLDIRPHAEFIMGHIPAAVNIPIQDLKNALTKLDKNVSYVAYCRGPFCFFADEAVKLLLGHGFQAVRMPEGYPDYTLFEFPVKKVS